MAGRKSIELAFDRRSNSLNFLRLVFAASVIVAHAIDLGRFGTDRISDRTTIGLLGVYGFFAISGYLIAASADHNSPGRYLWQRIVRIFPAFWVCLVVTAFGFALVGWFHQTGDLHRSITLHSFFAAPDGPVRYVVQNALLKINQFTITGTVWDGSLWTLFYEFLCYLLILGLAIVGLLRHRHAILAIAVAAWLIELFAVLSQGFGDAITGNGEFEIHLLTFVPIFLSGSLIYLYRDRIPDSGWIALACTGVAVGSLWIPIGGPWPGIVITSFDVFAIFVAYPVIWLGIHLPFRKVGSRNDYSYGIYIYGWPVQQLLVVWGVAAWGFAPYLLLTFVGVVPLAAASWWLIERNALRLKSYQWPSRQPRPEVGPEPRPETAPEAVIPSGAGVDPPVVIDPAAP